MLEEDRSDTSLHEEKVSETAKVIEIKVLQLAAALRDIKRGVQDTPQRRTETSLGIGDLSIQIGMASILLNADFNATVEVEEGSSVFASSTKVTSLGEFPTTPIYPVKLDMQTFPRLVGEMGIIEGSEVGRGPDEFFLQLTQSTAQNSWIDFYVPLERISGIKVKPL